MTDYLTYVTSDFPSEIVQKVETPPELNPP